ncbi:MAG: RNA polymerase sigma factor [Myxococcales bacterium]|nr:RNA polymerase sigma factor [Myxococcales bacterium]
MSTNAAPRPKVVTVDDATLVERARAGDERAFASLYRRHSRYVAGVVLRLMGDASELDDVVQDTFVAASRGLGGLKEPAKVRSWLVTISVRRVQRRLAQRSRRRMLGAELSREAASFISDPRTRRDVDELYDVLGRIPPKLRVPWVLARIEGESLPKVAQACGVSLATVKRRVADADTRIRRRLDA